MFGGIVKKLAKEIGHLMETLEFHAEDLDLYILCEQIRLIISMHTIVKKQSWSYYNHTRIFNGNSRGKSQGWKNNERNKIAVKW